MDKVREKKSSSGKWGVFWKRALSTVVLLAVLMSVLFFGGAWGVRALICIVCALTSWEWFRMLKISGRPAQPWLSLFHGALYPVAMSFICASESFFASYFAASLAAFAIIGLAIISFTWEMRRTIVGSRSLRSVSTTILSFIFPVWMFAACIPLLETSKNVPIPGAMTFGVKVVLWVFLYTKFVDIFAYLSGVVAGGRIFKGKKLIPHISPKKTREGLIGSFIFSLLAGGLLGDMMGVIEIFSLTGVSLLVLLFILAVLGDLAGSLIKRSLGVKDSSSLLPGIGGFYDLIDSPAFTMPAVLYVDYCLRLLNGTGLFGFTW